MKKKQTIVAWDDMPARAEYLAERRFGPLLRCWHVMDYDLKTLLRSVYLQGVNDMLELLIKRPYLLIETAPPEPTLDFSI